MIYFGKKNKKNRDLWIVSKLKEIEPGKKILDAGAGKKPYEIHCSHLDYYAQDFGEYEGDNEEKSGLQKKDWHYGKLDYKSDIIEIPVNENEFDVILCTEVFEHIPDPLSALDEFRRILKPGGKLLITTPICSLTHYSPYYYYNGFSENFYQYHLSNKGFENINIHVNGNYQTYLAQEVRRIRKLVNGKYISRNIVTIIISYIMLGNVLFLYIIDKYNISTQSLLSHGLFVEAFKNK